jgi:DNA-binding transcriptional LysR family regulator
MLGRTLESLKWYVFFFRVPFRDVMHPYDPTSLRLFVAVCEERNIALAAQREAIVPSAVSKRIAQMEAQAGTPLLARGRRGVAVTAAGETLWRYAREALQLLDRMQAELTAYAEGVQGQVRVFASMSALAQFLPADVGRFARDHAQVRVSMEEREIWEVVRGVEEGRADIGVCWDAVTWAGCSASPTARTSSPWCCPQAMRWPAASACTLPTRWTTSMWTSSGAAS